MSNTLIDNTIPSPIATNSNHSSWSKKALNGAAKFWFTIAVIGQMIFAYYIVARYTGWNITQKIEELHFTGDEPLGIFWVATHLFLAVIVTVCGPLQLIPQIRDKAPLFHRVNGRLYAFSAIAISLVGLIATIIRGPSAGIYNAAGFSINAVLIMVCAVMAVRFAMIGNISNHRRWAMRLFLMVSGTWFYRVILMFWFAANQGPVGHTDAFDGPFNIVLAFGFFILPLFILELYFRAQKSNSSVERSLVAISLFVLTLMMGAGVAITTIAMWIPMA